MTRADPDPFDAESVREIGVGNVRAPLTKSEVMEWINSTDAALISMRVPGLN